MKLILSTLSDYQKRCLELSAQALYTFDELSPEAQETAIDGLRDLNTYHEWWDSAYEDAERIGLKITGFDDYRATGTLELNAIDSIKEVLANHGEDCETTKTAQFHLGSLETAFADWWVNENPEDWEGWEAPDLLREFCAGNEAEDLVDDYRRALLEDYRTTLQKEYEYQTSDEQVKEAITANEYTFTADGVIA